MQAGSGSGARRRQPAVALAMGLALLGCVPTGSGADTPADAGPDRGPVGCGPCVGGTCAGDTCACPLGYTLSGEVCLALAADPLNCGSSGLACAPDERCAQGVCAPALLRVPPGTFQMGSPLDEPWRQDDEHPHPVRLTAAFLLGITEVSQAEYQALMGHNPAHFGPEGDGPACGPSCPVERVSWFDAVDYVNARSDLAGLPRCYGADYGFVGLACTGYRLPTEAEWEYAAQGDATQDGPGMARPCDGLPGCPEDFGWVLEFAGGQPHPVASRAPTGWGHHDLLGNVAEWVSDGYRVYGAGGAPIEDPLGPVDPEADRALRGGSWSVEARRVRSADRIPRPPTHRQNDSGFRIARTAPP